MRILTMLVFFLGLAFPWSDARAAEVEVCPALAAALAELATTMDREVPGAAFSPELKALPIPVEALIAMAIGDPVYGPRLDRALGTRSGLKEQIVAVSKDRDLRRLLVQAAHSDLIRRSNEEKANRGGRRVDAGFVGAGLVEQNVQNSLRQQPNAIETLTYESTGVVASTFARGDAAFFLNSTSRPADPTSLRQRTSVDDGNGGDLNFLPGGVSQVNQFDARNNPLARSWAQAAMTNRSFAKGVIRFDTNLDRIERASVGSGEYRDGYVLRMLREDGGGDFAKAAVITGIGEDEIPEDIPGLKAAYAKYGPRGGKNPQPRILTFSDLLRYLSSTPNPFQLFSGKRVGIVGPGDSGKGVVRYGLGLADPEAYGLDARDIPAVKTLLWYGQKAQTCDQFTASNRSFYADIGRGFRNKTIAPRKKLARFDVGAGEVFSLGSEGSETDDSDVLIVTTGYRSLVGKLLRAFLSPEQILLGNDLVEQAGLFRPVQAFEPSVGNVVIARQFIDPRTGNLMPIFVLGPAAGRIVSPAELVGVPENYVANVNHSWRAYLFGGVLADGLGTPTPASAVPRRAEWQRASAVRTDTLTPKVVPSNVVGAQAGDSLLITSELYAAFAQYNLSNVAPLNIAIARSTNGAYLFRVDPALSATQQTTVLNALAQNEVFGNLLDRNLGTGQRYRSATVEIRLTDGGRLDGERSRTRLLEEVAPAIADAPPSKPVVSTEQITRLNAFFFLSDDGRSYSNSGGFVAPTRSLACYGRGGYMRTARIFGDDMALTYDTAAKMVGEDYLRKLGWRRVEATRPQYEALLSLLYSPSDGRGRYSGWDGADEPPSAANRTGATGPQGLAAAARIFNQNPARAYDAAAQMFGEAYIRALGWYRFTGTLDEHNALRNFVSSARSGGSYSFDAAPQGRSSRAYGNEGFMGAIEIFDGDVERTYGGAVEIYGEAAVRELGWRKPGS